MPGAASSPSIIASLEIIRLANANCKVHVYIPRCAFMSIQSAVESLFAFRGKQPIPQALVAWLALKQLRRLAEAMASTPI